MKSPRKLKEIEMGLAWRESLTTNYLISSSVLPMSTRIEKIYDDEDHQRFFESIHYRED